jgi:hypothetical protein
MEQTNEFGECQADPRNKQVSSEDATNQSPNSNTEGFSPDNEESSKRETGDAALSEEDLDEEKNNARDAMNDDSYVLPAKAQDDNEPG